MFYIDTSQISLFGRIISIYALMPVAGAAAASLAALVYAKLKGINKEMAFRLTLVVLLISAVMQLYENHMPYWLLPFAVLFGSSAVVALYAYAGKRENKTCEYLGLSSVIMPIYLGFSKTGCFFTGCCYGKRYDGAFSVTYCKNAFCQVKNIPLFPIQLLTAVLLIITAAVAFAILIKNQSSLTWLCAVSFMWTVYYGCSSFGDKSSNLMIIGQTDFSKIICLTAFVIFLIVTVAEIKRSKNEEKHFTDSVN